MRVLVLRPGEAARRTAARLAGLGHAAVLAPLFEPAATGAAAPPGPFDAALATSAQAFALPPAADLAPWRALPTACVGQRTAQAAQAAGFAAPAVVTRDAADLVRALAPPAAGARYLYLAGRDRKPGLEEGLRAAGASVCPWIVYEARAANALPEPARQALAAGGADAALHFSRRGAATFCALCRQAGLESPARALRHFVLSADVAAGLAPLAPADVRIAAAPDEDSLLALL